MSKDSLIDRITGAETKKSRTSTIYSMRAGFLVITAAIVLTFVGLRLGFVNGGNFVEILWAYFIFTASLFGINMVRIGAENVTRTKSGQDTTKDA